MSTTSGCKDTWITKSEFESKISSFLKLNLFLQQHLYEISSLVDKERCNQFYFNKDNLVFQILLDERFYKCISKHRTCTLAQGRGGWSYCGNVNFVNQLNYSLMKRMLKLLKTFKQNNVLKFYNKVAETRLYCVHSSIVQLMN